MKPLRDCNLLKQECREQGFCNGHETPASHSTNIDDLGKKVRRVFSGRTHKFDLPKFTVVQDKNFRNKRVIVAPYDKTVEKIEKLLASDRLALLERLEKQGQSGNKQAKNPLGLVRVDYIPLSAIDAEREAIKKGKL